MFVGDSGRMGAWGQRCRFPNEFSGLLTNDLFWMRDTGRAEYAVLQSHDNGSFAEVWVLGGAGWLFAQVGTTATRTKPGFSALPAPCWAGLMIHAQTALFQGFLSVTHIALPMRNQKEVVGQKLQ